MLQSMGLQTVGQDLATEQQVLGICRVNFCKQKYKTGSWWGWEGFIASQSPKITSNQINICVLSSN